MRERLRACRVVDFILFDEALRLLYGLVEQPEVSEE
jgi:hypothetical protein